MIGEYLIFLVFFVLGIFISFMFLSARGEDE